MLDNVSTRSKLIFEVNLPKNSLSPIVFFPFLVLITKFGLDDNLNIIFAFHQFSKLFFFCDAIAIIDFALFFS